MKIQGTLNQFAIIFGLSLVIMTGQVSAQIFTNLHSLVISNGTTPYAGLVLAGNTVYGTAENYGEQADYPGNSGSVFKMSINGSSFTNMHTFTQGTNDGGNPYGGVVLAGSTLYGTVLFGGPSNSGCIFEINTNGTGLTNVYVFPPLQPHSPFYTNQAGAYPNSSLIISGATLYGATSDGGAYSWGTVFGVNTNGSGFVNLHDFDVTNGQYPNPVIMAGNTLYGTTTDGGTNSTGIVFALSTNGMSFTDLYSFAPAIGYPYTNSGGATPVGSLVLSGSTLYGVTSGGGSNACGTVFSIGTNGTGFTVLHMFPATNAFGINSDGAHPQAGLVLWSNVLYGTALDGGGSGYGSIFSLKIDGTEFTTLYSFSSTNNVGGTNTDGAYPRGSLLLSGSVLYGTASAGGAAGYGTIFSILFPPPLAIAVVGTNAVVSWPTNVTGFSLEATTNLPPLVWSAVSGQYTVTNPITGKQKYFRLMHP